MVVLRSREVIQTQSIPKPLTEQSTPEPITPARISEPSMQSPTASLTLNIDHMASDSVSNSQSNRRRSLRLASKLVTGDGCVQNGSSKRKKTVSSRSEEERNSDSNLKDNEDGSGVAGNSSGILGLRSGKRIVSIEEEVKNQSPNGSNNAEGSDRYSRDDRGKGKLVTGDDCVQNGSSKRKKTVSSWSEEERNSDSNLKDNEDGSGVASNSSGILGLRSGKRIVSVEKEVKNQSPNGSNNAEGSDRYSKDDKGKGKLVNDDSKSNTGEVTQLELESQLQDLRSKLQGLVDSFKDALESGNLASNSNSGKSETRMERFREIARKSASRFAHFEPQEQQEENVPRVDVETPSEEVREKVEDWPGPFSTAMKIIRDRANKLNSQQGHSTSKEPKPVPITWIPRKTRCSNLSRAHVPSLLDLCMKILVKNVDAVSSLDHVPDALRHRICQLLCDCWGMNSCFLELLVRGSPTEIRIKDCSWLTEEEFTKCFGACDTSNLSVLQLDQCGRCIADYILPATLARSSRSMPALIALSLSGACRLTDIGLGSLLSAAPALKSINLSQCSLLTSFGIGTLAQSLGSHLQELYIDDCQSLDVKLILPALKKLEHLEVLSLAGMQAVRDDFVREFVGVRGHNMKELVLSDCTNLTDSCIKVIAETCPGLRSLDLVNLYKLTDATLGYLANSCQQIQTLKFCRNTFSDEAIAAFLETSGEPLKELSLNNVAEVGNNTALALARRSRNLEKLDLSWCRKLRDEAVGLIVDSCSSLKVLKLFGCGQITNVFLDGHSNEGVEIIGVKLTPVLEHIRVHDMEVFPLRYTS
ncbi:uncharacterized protein [Euphorbia lathyris]|uniref:uncharacterized protein isoform X2 n=1 Tax=Euphorbia lathyris TaxID=212925 RepID=UPI0033137F0E